MSSYNTPVLHNGSLNSVVNTSDLTTNNTTSTLNMATADSRYLKLSGGTETGTVSFSNGLTSSATVTVPTITFSAGAIVQTAAMLGYTRSVNLAIAGGSISNGLVSSPAYNTLTLSSGVYMVSYYHNITCTASVTFLQITHGITASSTGVYTSTTTNSSYASETIAVGVTKQISGTYMYRCVGAQSIYAPITLTYVTTGVITINFGITAIRIA
jgi:hypothetical protein